jgi:AcrR family transcriptional regulator
VTQGEERDGRAERGDATRAALVDAARELFAERGYSTVGTNEVVDRAGVTRGAMYHHFRDKKDLFRAVYEQTEEEVVAATAARMGAIDDPWELLVAGMRSFFDACTDPALMQIGLVDAPAVLGWQEWREIGTRYGFGIVTFGLQNAMDAGVLRRADVQQLAHLVMGALGEAAMLLANAEDPRAARTDIEATVLALFEGLRTEAG